MIMIEVGEVMIEVGEVMIEIEGVVVTLLEAVTRTEAVTLLEAVIRTEAGGIEATAVIVTAVRQTGLEAGPLAMARWKSTGGRSVWRMRTVTSA